MKIIHSAIMTFSEHKALKLIWISISPLKAKHMTNWYLWNQCAFKHFFLVWWPKQTKRKRAGHLVNAQRVMIYLIDVVLHKGGVLHEKEV